MFATLCNFSQQKNHTEEGTVKEGGGKREYKSTRYRKREAGNSDPHAPPPSPLVDWYRAHKTRHENLTCDQAEETAILKTSVL